MKTIDERKNQCPIPLVHTMSACKDMKEGEELTVKVSSDTPVQNIKRFALSKGYDVDVKENASDDIDVIITIHEECDCCECGCEGGCDCDCDCGCDDDEDYGYEESLVVAIGSNKMGDGDEQLGKNLMKAFIFSVSKQEILPNVMLFYNSGAFLTTEGSESLDDLKELEAAGVTIMTCGTCLDYYKIKDKLKVGIVTNMYDIVAAMEMATSVIKP